MNRKTPTRPAATSAPRATGQRLALLICNGTFQDGALHSLSGVKKDHEAMTRVLGAKDIGGFNVTALLDEGLLAVRKAIARICLQSRAEDTLLIYYSGYSFAAADGNLYLPVADSDKELPDATAIDADFMLGRIRQSACRRVVLLVDGCHSGAFFNNNRGIPDGLFAITACAANEYTADTPTGGAFTQALVSGLESADADRDGDGRISVDELHEFIKARLAKQGYASTPQKWVWNVREPIYLTSAPPKVFLSYCRQDVAKTQRLRKALEAAGFVIWLDLEGIQSGDWKARVTEGLSRARALVFLMTPESLGSEAVRKELAFATAKGLPILPVTLGEMPKDSIPDWYRFDYDTIHRHTLHPSFPAAEIQMLAQAIRSARC